VPNFKCTYTFEEEVYYPNKKEAELASKEWAEEYADEESLIVVKVEVEEVK